ncbi:MAG: trehalose-phosphatase [Tannerellaceae bacterium]|nr:trehalose-phosphatase [Tannerellaceae bacterium]
MQEIISTQTVEQWAKDFIDELKEVKKKNHILQEKIIKKENLKRISKQYNKAKRRLILLDYDETLVPFYKRPDQAVPFKDFLKLLATLAEDLKNRVVISSGRDRRKLDEWLGDLPIDLAAEHGAFYKEKGKWHEKIHEIAWDEEILRIMKHIVKRTPRSRLKIKKTALVWHYRSVDVWLAELRVNQLVNALMAPCARANLQIMRGNKIVEVKSSDFSKGAEAMRLISEENFDFIMAV